MKKFKVYVKPNEFGYITGVESSAFLKDTIGWILIDEGAGDKYHHAQRNYFPEPIVTDSDAYRYKLVDGKAVECTDEEIAEQEEKNQPEQPEARTDDVLNVLLGVTE